MRVSRLLALDCFLALVCLLALVACKRSGGSGGGRSDPDPSPAGEAAITRGPQIGLLDTDSVLIAWRSDRPAMGTVEFGEDPLALFEHALPEEATEHVARLDGLAPGTRYEYRILLDGELAAEGFSFTTVPADPEAPFRVAVFGDSGADTDDQRDVARRVLEGTPDLVLITGDVVYDSGSERQLDPAYFTPYAHLIDHIPFYPALGNHDVQTRNGRPLLEALYLPVNDADGSERYYSFDRGLVHFVVLDSTGNARPGSAQHDWLVEDLQRTSALWVIASLHHPPYSSSLHGSSRSARDIFEGLPAELRVDLVLGGHDHNYERTYPVFENTTSDVDQEPRYRDLESPIYIVTGGGGRRLYPSGAGHFTAHSESVFHHVEIDVETDATHGRLRIKGVRAVDGSTLDAVVLEKTR